MPASFPPSKITAASLTGATPLAKQILSSNAATDVLTYLGVGSTPTSPLSATNLTVTGVVKLPSYTVATLPSASSVGAGAVAFATDLTSPTYGGTLTGGGTVGMPVYSDGAVWRS